MNGFIELAAKYQRQLEKDGDVFLLQIGKFLSIRNVLVQVYHELVAMDKCVKLEQLASEEKQALWQEAKRISEVQEQNYLVEVCKALHGFGTFILLKEAGQLV